MSSKLLGAAARPWTPVELTALRARYLTDSGAALARDLGRTRGAVWFMARKRGVRKTIRWTAAEERKLWILWGEVPLDNIAHAMGRTPSAVYEHALRIGLRCGAPQGFESIWAAARRVGFTRAQLRVILQWAGVPLRRTMSRPGGAPRWMLLPADADAAVAKWHTLETVTAAARRLGVTWPTLHRWLLAARASGDRSVPAEPAVSRAKWRVPTATIDRIANQHLVALGRRRAA